ncbi:unnamed protein product, partial [Tilletia controversa]
DISLLKKRGCKCGSTTVTNIQDEDLIDAKGFALNLDLLSKRGSTTVSNIQDDDLLIDAKGLVANADLLSKRGSTTVSNIEDTDAVDLKGVLASFTSIL